MNDESQPPFDFEQRLREFYRRRSRQTQQHILPALWGRIESRLSAADQESESLDARSPDLLFSSEDHIPMLPTEPASPQKHVLRRPTFSIAAVLLTIAIIATFVWFGAIRNHQAATRPNAATATAQPCTIPTPLPGTVGKPVRPYHAPHGTATYAGITIAFDSAYADATQTVVSIRVYSASSSHAFPDRGIISDENGDAFWTLSSGGISPSTGPGRYTLTANPLPVAMLSGPHTLTLTILTMDALKSGSTGTTFVSGTWQIPFTVTPAVPKVYNLHVAPLVKCGVSIQPVRLDVATDTTGASTGGTRLVLKISGLPAKDSIPFFVSDYHTSSSASLGSHTDSKPDHLDLAGIDPAWVGVQNVDPFDYEQTVGPTGIVMVEAVYFTPLTQTGDTVSLHIDDLNIDYVFGQSVGGSYKKIGPWDFQLPLD
jgi:hypothetical protein